MEIQDTPTYNRVGLALSVLVDVVEKEMKDSPDGLFSFEKMRLIGKTIPILLSDRDEVESVREKLLEGLGLLEEVSLDFPEVAQETAAGAQMLVMAMFQLVSELVDNKITSEAAKMAPLARQNAQKGKAIKEAKKLAQLMWSQDKEQKIRIGRMAAIIYGELHQLGYGDMLRSNQDPVKDWIRPVAPAYACKGGKPKKTP